MLGIVLLVNTNAVFSAEDGRVMIDREAPAFGDDSGWMNCRCTCFQRGKYADDSETDSAAIMKLDSKGQICHALGNLTKDKVYKVEFTYKTGGQVESLSIFDRQRGGQWLTSGQIAMNPRQQEKTTFTYQFRAKQDIPGSSVFISSSGPGLLYCYHLKVTEFDDFQVPKDFFRDSGGKLPNAHFSLFDSGWLCNCAWYLHGGDRKTVARWKDGKFVFPGMISMDHHVKVKPGVRYVLRLKGTPGAKFRYVVGRQHGQKLPGGYEGDITLGEIDGEVEIPMTFEVPRYGVLKDYIDIGAEFASNEARPTELDEVELYAGRLPDPPVAIGFRPEPALVRRQHTVKVGEKIVFDIAAEGIKVGAKAKLKVHDYLDRPVDSIEFVFTGMFGGVGAHLDYEVRNTGYLVCSVGIGDVAGVSQIPLQVSALPDVPPSDGKTADFLLGTHLDYEEKPPRKFPQCSLDTIRMFRWIGLQGERDHCVTKWYRVEPEQGKWVFPDKIFKAHDIGFDILGMFDTTAKWASTGPENTMSQGWPQGYMSYPPSDFQGWEDYVTKMTGHFKGVVRCWEIWNEPDHIFMNLSKGGPWKDKPSVYTELVKHASIAAKKVDPDVKIVLGAVTAGGDWLILKAIENGALPYADAVSFHGYGRSGASVGKGALAFKGIMDKLNAAMEREGRKLPIWDSEVGTGVSHDGIRGRDVVKKSFIQEILAHRAAGFQRQYIYSAYRRWAFNDYKGFPVFLGFNNAPRIQHALLAVYDRFLGNAKFVANLGDDAKGVHVYEFRDNSANRTVIAGWSSVGATGWKQDALLTGKAFNSCGNVDSAFSGGKLQLCDEVFYFLK